MAVTTVFDNAVPFISGGKVVEWELGMTYTNSTSGSSTFYQSEFSTTIQSSAVTGLSSDFTPKAEGSWTRAQLLTLMSPSEGLWNQVFASQVDSVITNPPDNPVPDNSYVIPDAS
tara:strand:- start:72 stop:416 length:345 start_codon:yes stop_codon:yes gene_type:complete